MWSGQCSILYVKGYDLTINFNADMEKGPCEARGRNLSIQSGVSIGAQPGNTASTLNDPNLVVNPEYWDDYVLNTPQIVFESKAQLT